MNEFQAIPVDSLWLSGAVAVSFFAGCVYRLCILLSRNSPVEAGREDDLEAIQNRYQQEMRHIRQLQKELIEVRQAVAQRTPTVQARARAPAQPAELGIDPFKLAIAGAGIEVLMSRCRLSRAEAELVYSVHGAGAGRKSASRPQVHTPRHPLTA